MSQRFFVYPLLVVVALQLVPLLRRDCRWFAAQIAQLLLIALASAGAMFFENDLVWVWIAWGLFLVFVVAPRVWLGLAMRAMKPATLSRAARYWSWGGRFVWGQLGQLYRAFGKAVRGRSETTLDELAQRPMPDSVRGEVRMWKVWLLVSVGAWERAVAAYRQTESWGTLGIAMLARVFVARAFAETGDFGAALRSLQLVALSPRTLGWLEREFSRTRALVLERVQAAGATEVCAPELRSLAAAEEHARAWRRLVQWRRPAPVTRVMVGVCVAVWLADELYFNWVIGHPLWTWAGNIPEAVRHGEWWRPASAMFLHANLLHLAMNMAALWMFGTAVEQTLGRVRLLVIFLVAGAAANFASAHFAVYDVSVGASGGIFGLVAAFGVAVYRLRSPIYATVRRRLLVMLALMVAVDFTIGGLEPQVDNFAHAGGFVVGWLLAWLLWPRRQDLPSTSGSP